ncbi:hypothetical protein FQN50_009077 [Emmonsiellopsis sp. PD_5]|nr:hypothetical protein FQN50_009077 [Emmonsiellopsis sp. PD_5]
MAPAGNDPTPRRKVTTTYGKSSRGLDYSKGFRLSSASPRTQTADSFLRASSKTGASLSRVPKEGTGKANGDNRGARQQLGLSRPPKLSKSVTAPTLEFRPSNPRKEQSVYDIESSSDEQNDKEEPWRKRRKVETPKIERATRGVGNNATNPRRASHGASPYNPVQSKGLSTMSVNAEKARGIEVVIRTPTKQHRESLENRHKGAYTESEDKDIPTIRPSYSSTSPPIGRIVPQNSHLLSSPSSNLTTRTKPTQKPARTTKPASDDLVPKTPSTDHKETQAGDYRNTSGAANTTPSRKRIVDALSRSPRRRHHSPISSSASDISDDFVYSQSSSEEHTTPLGNSISAHSGLPSTLHRTEGDAQSGSPDRTQHSQTGGLKNTYSRQRSFLTEGNIADALETQPQPASIPKHAVNNGMATLLSTKYTRPRPPGHDDDDNAGNGSVRNIYELRRAGGNARFEGLVETLFEDIEDPTASISRRRSGLIELCSNLTEHQFARRFLTNALEKRLEKCTRCLTDIICMYLISCAYGLLLSSGPISSISLHTCSREVLRLIPSLIPEKSDIHDISKSRSSKMTRSGQSSLRDLCDKLAQSKIWPEGNPPKSSPQILGLKCLEMSVRRVRESGDAVQSIPDSTLAQLVDLLLQHSIIPQDRDINSLDFFIIELVFSILESYTVVLGSLNQNQEEIVKKLSQLGPLLSRLSRYPETCGRQIQLLEIRLILNLTNNNPSLCEGFSTPEIIGALMTIILPGFELVSEDFSSEKKDSLLDTVILALGALINLTEWNATARQLILKTRNDSTTFLDNLLGLFQEKWETTSEVRLTIQPLPYSRVYFEASADILQADSVVQTHSNVAFGYLSVLLSTVCLDDEPRTHVKKSLHSRNLNRLLTAVEEFLHYHRKVEKELQDTNGEYESVAGFTSRLQGIVDRIKQAEGAG